MAFPLAALFFLVTARWCLQVAHAGRQVFDVMDFGAIADGETDDSKVIYRRGFLSSFVHASRNLYEQIDLCRLS